MSELKSINGEATIDYPNDILEYWACALKCEKINETTQHCNIKNLLLRGCYIKNTNYTIGIVMYAGMKTKIMMNSSKPPHKVSNVMNKMNMMLYTVFVFQVVIIITFAILNQRWVSAQLKDNQHPYLGIDESASIKSFILQMLTYWVAYSHLIPISLYVIIEMLKLGQAYLINNDV